MLRYFSEAVGRQRLDTREERIADVTKCSSFLRRLASDRSGTIAVMFALAMVPVIGLVGGAIDYGRAVSERSKLQAVLDSSVLAAGREYQITGSESAAQFKAVAFFNEHMSNGSRGAITTNTVDPATSTLTLGGHVSSPTPFLSIVGVNSIAVRATAEAKLLLGDNSKVDLEVALMLDISSSMKGNKLDDLKTAAQKFVEMIVWKDQSEHYSRVALAPFSSYINLGQYFEKVTNRTPYGDKKKCVKERISQLRYTDAAPRNNWHFVAYGHSAIGAPVRERDFDCKTQTPIVPLTDDDEHLTKVIGELVADGGKAGHLGTVWSWYLLSPNWGGILKNYSSATVYPPAPYNNKKVRKIAVLITDGAYNTKYNGPLADRQARWFCEAMKASGLEIFTIGVEVKAQTTLTTLRDYCATDPSYHYEVGEKVTIEGAYMDIAMRIAQLRLSK